MFTPSKHSIAQNNRAAHIGSVPLRKIPYGHVTVTSGKNVIKSGAANHKPMIDTPSVGFVGRGFTSNGQGVPTAPTMAEDGYLGTRGPGLFHTMKTHSLVHRPAFQSPAKVLAKLKDKVQREQMCDREGVGEKGTEREDYPRSVTQGGVLPSPRKRQHHWTIAELKENQDFAFHEADALTLTPTHTPQKAFSRPYSGFSSKDLPLPSPRKNIAGLLKPVNRSPKRPILAVSPKKAVSQPHLLASTKYHERPAVIRDSDDVFGTTSRATPVKNQPPSLKSSANSCAIGLSGDCEVGEDEQHHIFNYGLPCHESTSITGSQDLEDGASMVSSGIAGTAFTAAVAQSETSATTDPEGAGSQCEIYIDEAPPLTARHRPTLVEDQLIHASPRISIPKKRQAGFLSKTVVEAAGSRHQQDDNVAGIQLRKWVLMFNGTGLFVNGFRRDKDMLWHSNIIAERVSSNVVKTISGSIYVLVGKMDVDINSALPRWLLQKFLFGFPQKWNIYLDTFLSESKVRPQPARPKRSKAPKTICSPSAPCLPAGPKVSRSGRVIKPPLEFWKGGRIILDAFMNVTVLEGYGSTICEEPKSTPVTRRMTQKTQRPARVFLPPEDSSGVEEEKSVPLRKVKMAHHRPQMCSSDPEKELPQKTQRPARVFLSSEDSSGVEEDKSVPLRKVKMAHHRPQMCSSDPEKELPHKAQRPARVFLSPEDSSGVEEDKSVPLRKVKMVHHRPQMFSSDPEKELPHKAQRPARVFLSPEDSSGVEEDKSVPLRKVKMVHHRPQMFSSDPEKELSQKAQRPARVFLSPEDCIDVEEEKSVPLREVKMAHHRPPRSSSDLEKEPSRTNSPEGHNLQPRKSSPLQQRLEPVAHPDHHSLRDVNKRSSQQEPPVPRKQTKRKKEQIPSGKVTGKPEQGNKKQTDVKREAGRHTNRKRSLDTAMKAQVGGHDLEEEVSQSDDDLTHRKRSKGKNTSQSGSRKKQSKKTHTRILDDSETQSSQASLDNHSLKSSEEDDRSRRKRRGNRQKPTAVTNNEVSSSKDLPKPKNPTKARANKQTSKAASKVALQEEEERWSEAELVKLHEAVAAFPKHMVNFWLNVAMMVSTRSAEECHEKYTTQKSCSVTSARKKKVVPPKKQPVAKPQITARVGTLKRKQQMRNFLDHMPKDDHDDFFTSSPMQNKQVKLPTASTSGREHDMFMSLGEEPLTPRSAGYPTAKTPQCLHITPGMMGSVNRNDDDKYIYQLQKRMKSHQAKVHKYVPTSKFTPTPPEKRTMKRCGSPENDWFVIKEMFPDEEVSAESDQDYYFTDD